MFRLAVFLLVIALGATLFGFGGVAAYSWVAAKVVFFCFILLAVLTALGGALRQPL